MDNNTTVTLAIVAILATCVGALIYILKFVFTRLLPRLDKGNVAFERIVSATKANTQATKAANEYLKKRDNHYNEMHGELIKAVREIPQQIIKSSAINKKAIEDAQSNQTIDKQEVNTQIVNGK